VIDKLGIQSRTIDISPAVDGYLATSQTRILHAEGKRHGPASELIVLFDLSGKIQSASRWDRQQDRATPWLLHLACRRFAADQSLGDLFKTQVWQLATYLGVPDVIVSKPASAEPDRRPDPMSGFRNQLRRSRQDSELAGERVQPRQRLSRADSIRRKSSSFGRAWPAQPLERKLPTVAMVSAPGSANPYLRPSLLSAVTAPDRMRR